MTFTRLRDALEERTGWPSALAAYARLPVRGGPSFRHSTLAAIVALLAAAFVTGFALALYYSPGVTSAWASLAWFERELPFGALVRAVHVHSAGALLVASALHLLGLAVSGTYRRPREAAWWLSLALLVTVLGVAMTGTVLPMDEQGYWASRVEMGIVASTPVVGALVKSLLVSGNDAGNLTLTRHFALHALLLAPAALALVWAQVRLAPTHGLVRTPDGTGRVEAWWPGQALRDAIAALVALGALLAVAALVGAPLGAPADPAAGYSARPVWFFRALFELRRHFEGPLEPVATMVIPGLVLGYLAALPVLDRGARPRLRVLWPAALVLVGVGLGIVVSYRRDAADAALGKQLAASERTREKALALAAQGVPPQGPVYMLRNTPEERGRRLFADKCAGCHAVGGEGGGKAPDLAGYLSAPWLVGVVAHPDADEFFGLTKVSGMEPYEALGPEKLGRLAQFLVALRGTGDRDPATFEGEMLQGRKLFESEGCDSCHPITPGETGAAPNLAGYGSDAWLVAFLEDPADPLFFGTDNDMPGYKGKLDERQFKDLVAYLRALESAPVQYRITASTGH